MPLYADTYAVRLGGPGADRVPKIIGASGQISGDPASFTTADYFQWYGITHHRYWFKPRFSQLNWKGGVTTLDAFLAATEAIRREPLRQGTAEDVSIDWAAFNVDCNDRVRADIEKMQSIGVMPMIVDTGCFTKAPLADWGERFEYWKHWYSNVYFFASRYDITLYQFSNEPHAFISYPAWKSRWLVAADAARKAIADVNRDFKKRLTGGFNGPTEPGPYWDYEYPDPETNFHGWGSVSWADIHTDIRGQENPAIWNYDLYDFHKYSNDGPGYAATIRELRRDIAHAKNAPSPDIPILISEINTSTGGHFKSKNLDNEDLHFGISVAQIMQATAINGRNGLGEEGGIFLFKLGSPTEETTLGNKLSYVSPESPRNYGGITRGGACFQMYARHFRGGKPLLSLTETSGAHPKRRSVAVLDEPGHAYYFYSSLMNGTDAEVSLDLSGLEVSPGAPVAVQRVDANNMGQITELLAISSARSVSLSVPNNTAFLVRIPRGTSPGSMTELDPLQDTWLSPSGRAGRGDGPTLEVSLHHTDPSLRRLAFLQFPLTSISAAGRILLKLNGRNAGADPAQREIIHVYGAEGGAWSAGDLTWANAPGVGKCVAAGAALQPATGLGTMIEIEDNYAGLTPGQGLGIHGKFLGQISFASAAFRTNWLDVTEYVRSLQQQGKVDSVTFVAARIVRYNVNQYSNAYYRKGVYDYDSRSVEIASSRNPDPALRPKLCLLMGDPGVGAGERRDGPNADGGR